MTNPFDCSFLDHNVLTNISTGMHAIEEIQSSLLNAVKNGKDQMEAFVTRTFSECKRERLYIRISRSRAKTFGNMAKGTKIKVQGQIKSSDCCLRVRGSPLRSIKQRTQVPLLNKLRSKLELQKCNTIGKLPPCENAFKQHVKRVMWQTKIRM